MTLLIAEKLYQIIELFNHIAYFVIKNHFMKTIYISMSLLFISSLCLAQDNIPSAEAQIKAAVMAAPADMREKATVYGYSPKGEFAVLRKGSNEMICLAD